MRQISTIIEIGTGKVVSIIGSAGPYEDTHILGSSFRTYAGYKERRWVDKHALAPAMMEALHEAEHKAGHRSKEVHVGIPADFVRVVCTRAELTLSDHANVTEEDVRRLHALARKELDVPQEYRLIHRCPIRYILDDVRKTMDPVGRKCTRISVILSCVLAEKWFLSGVTKILENNGYSVSTYIAASYAEAIRCVPQEKRDHGAVMLDIGKTSTCVMVVRGDGLVFHRVLNFGGDTITHEVARVFAIKPPMADELKRRSIYGLSLGEDDCYEVCDRETYHFSRFPALQVQEVIESVLTQLLEKVGAVLDKSGCSLPGYVPVYVTGGTASMRGIREFVQKQVNRNTVIVQPQSTCFNQPCYSSSLAVLDMALEAETDDSPGLFGHIKNFFGR